ncbi:MAG: hypothetical protein JWO62_2853 [Acidimicrobiaceae bacterium]|nr:hypothetical protein [Acidimicrobiaceae bacterium]
MVSNVIGMLTSARRSLLEASHSPPGTHARSRLRTVAIFAIWLALVALTILLPADWLALGISAVGASITIVVSVRRRKPARVWPWWLIFTAFVLFLLGNVVRQGANLPSNLSGGRTLIPDIMIAPGYILIGLALIGFERERERAKRYSFGVILDGLMAGLALLAIAWVFLIQPQLANRQVSAVVRLVVISYPAMSLFLVVMMLQIAFGAGRLPGNAEKLLFLCVSAMFIGDTLATLSQLHLLLSITGPRVRDVVYLTAFLLAACTASDASMRTLTEPASGSPPAWPVGRIGLVAVALSVPTVLVLHSSHGPLAQRFTLFAIIVGLTATAILQILRALRVAEHSEAKVSFQALHDSLTGLPNRQMMERHLTGVLERAALNDKPVGLLFLDIDRFKLINDTVGHTLGDELLVQVASRLKANVRPTDLVTRIGGDEFVIVLGQTVGVADALEFANRLRNCLRDPFTVDETEFFVTVSIGLACVPGGGAEVSAEVLIRDADTAMYRAKEAGRDAVAVFDDSMRAQLAERVEIERDLRHAVERRQLHVAFQPIVSTTTGSIVGVEALVRWLHPTLGVIMPTRFIPLAEETDLIIEIGAWVLDEALRQVAFCRTIPGLEHLKVSVNLSAVQLRDENLVEHVGRALAAHSLPGSALCLELTETVVMGDPETAMAAFAAIRRLDVRLAIDDFGTEYSSLAYLQRLPVDTLKIDRSFVDGLSEPDSAADTLVAAIIAIARALGMETVAEGVETVDQAKRLVALGCDSMQGYLYSRPVRSDQLLEVARLLSRKGPVEERSQPETADASGGFAVA